MGLRSGLIGRKVKQRDPMMTITWGFVVDFRYSGGPRQVSYDPLTGQLGHKIFRTGNHIVIFCSFQN